MSSRWFRVYEDILDDPKVQMLSPELFRTWMNLLALASRGRGILPSVATMAFALRASATDMQARLDELVLAGLIDIRPDGRLEPHNWAGRQWQSDGSAERMRRHRERKRTCDVTCDVTGDVTGDVTVTAPDPDPETDSEKNPPTPHAAPASSDEGVEGLGSLGVGVGECGGEASPPSLATVEGREPLAAEGSEGPRRDPPSTASKRIEALRAIAGLGGEPSIEARRKVCARLALADAEPLVALYRDWPGSQTARDPDAKFIAAAPKILANARPEVRAACRPTVAAGPEIAPLPPVRCSPQLAASLARMANLRGGLQHAH